MKACHTIIVSTEKKEGRVAETERWEGRRKERHRGDLYYNNTNVVN